MGPFPAGVILHSYMGSAEMVPELSDLGSYFSFSGFLTSMKEHKVKKMLNSVKFHCLSQHPTTIKDNKQNKRKVNEDHAAKTFLFFVFRYQRIEF
jgi:Tat protein secretion system quality control protein TatD with DNase activity